MSEYVPFDRDWHAIGFIEPEFVTETLGWANEQILVDAGMIPVRTYMGGPAVTWVPEAFTTEPLPEPKRLTKTVLKWCWTGPSKFRDPSITRPLPAVKPSPMY